MIAINKELLENNILRYEGDIELHLLKVKSKLDLWLKKSTIGTKANLRNLQDDEKLYLRFLKRNLSKIVKASPNEMKCYLIFFEKIIPSSKRGNNNFKDFKDALLTKMGYSLLRSGDMKSSIEPFYPKFYSNVGIKACVYCNSQLTICVDKRGGQKSAKFQVDHFYPKSEYPFLSISFFNLYPSCANCNLHKKEEYIDFELYSSESKPKSNLLFELDKKSLALFRINKKVSELKINFKGKEYKQYNNLFSIQSIYDTQKDLAAEIVLKSEVYNNSYKKALHKSFKKLYPNEFIPFNRFIVGNYTDSKDIHKRPMSKFMQDIARDLGIID